MTNQAISDHFREMNKKRKHKTGGFKDPKVRKKAWETRKKNILKEKDVQREKSPTE